MDSDLSYPINHVISDNYNDRRLSFDYGKCLLDICDETFFSEPEKEVFTFDLRDISLIQSVKYEEFKFETSNAYMVYFVKILQGCIGVFLYVSLGHDVHETLDVPSIVYKPTPTCCQVVRDGK